MEIINGESCVRKDVNNIKELIFLMKELRDIIKTYKKKYELYIDRVSFENIFLKHTFLDLLNEDDYQKRKNIWNNRIIGHNKYFNEIYKLSNPYFIGFGNPESKILFIGKEKGFDIQTFPELLLEESINNIYHWEKIISSNLFNQPTKIQSLFDFSPLFPLSYNYNKPFRKSHTWYIYSKFLASLYTKQEEYNKYFNREDYFKSLFYNCFLTEFNFVPSKYSKGLGEAIHDRIEFFKHDFFNRFKIVIIGARTYFKEKRLNKYNDHLIQEIFRVKFGKKIIEGRLETKEFISDEKIVILTSQLSGAAGWSNESIDLLAKHIKNNQKDKLF